MCGERCHGVTVLVKECTTSSLVLSIETNIDLLSRNASTTFSQRNTIIAKSVCKFFVVFQDIDDMMVTTYSILDNNQ